MLVDRNQRIQVEVAEALPTLLLQWNRSKGVAPGPIEFQVCAPGRPGDERLAKRGRQARMPCPAIACGSKVACMSKWPVSCTGLARPIGIEVHDVMRVHEVDEKASMACPAHAVVDPDRAATR